MHNPRAHPTGGCKMGLATVGRTYLFLIINCVRVLFKLKKMEIRRGKFVILIFFPNGHGWPITVVSICDIF